MIWQAMRRRETINCSLAVGLGDKIGVSLYSNLTRRSKYGISSLPASTAMQWLEAETGGGEGLMLLDGFRRGARPWCGEHAEL